jgi:vancomycin permeability regulator SanA
MNLLIIHGFALLPSGEISPILKARLDTAILFVKDHPDISTILVTGGGSRSSKTESKVMHNYLIDNHVAIPILEENFSINTIQNVVNCQKLAETEQFENIYVLVGTAMLNRTNYIYQKWWPEIISKIRWVPVNDGYKGNMERFWLLCSRIVRCAEARIRTWEGVAT